MRVRNGGRFVNGAGLCLFAALLLSGCGHVGGYLGFWQKQRELNRTFEEEPGAELLRELAPADCYLLLGKVSLDRPHPGPILVVAVTDKFKKREIVATRILQSPVAYYQAYLPEGQYDLYFFADLDGNGYFDANEMVAGTLAAPVAVTKSNVSDGLTIRGPAIALNLAGPGTCALPVHVQVKSTASAYASLEDEFFDPKYGAIGLYDPKALLAHTQRYMFSLGRFDPAKTTVLFVHGVGGTPRDFKHLADGLDRSRYQPVFFFYPSGIPLQKLGSLLASILAEADRNQEFRSQHVIVVAHSMGGLVALAGLNQLCKDGVPPYLKGYVSFNSPYGGVDSAKAGVEHAPAVVASWRDVVPDSPFLERLYQGRASQDVPFYLFFGYETGKSSDGTIALQSQLDPRVHLSARRSYGFNATHEGILNDDAARRAFVRVLAALAE